MRLSEEKSESRRRVEAIVARMHEIAREIGAAHDDQAKRMQFVDELLELNAEAADRINRIVLGS